MENILNEYKEAVKNLLAVIPRDEDGLVDLEQMVQRSDPPNEVLRIFHLWQVWYDGYIPGNINFEKRRWGNIQKLEVEEGVSTPNVRRIWKDAIRLLLKDGKLPTNWNTWFSEGYVPEEEEEEIEEARLRIQEDSREVARRVARHKLEQEKRRELDVEIRKLREEIKEWEKIKDKESLDAIKGLTQEIQELEEKKRNVAEDHKEEIEEELELLEQDIKEREEKENKDAEEKKKEREVKRKLFDKITQQILSADAQFAFTWEALGLTVALPLLGAIAAPGQASFYLYGVDRKEFAPEHRFRKGIRAQERIQVKALRSLGIFSTGKKEEEDDETWQRIMLNSEHSFQKNEFPLVPKRAGEEGKGFSPVLAVPDWNTSFLDLLDRLEYILDTLDKETTPKIFRFQEQAAVIWNNEVVGWNVIGTQSPEVRKIWKLPNKDVFPSLGTVFRYTFTGYDMTGEMRTTLRDSFFVETRNLISDPELWQIGGQTLGQEIAKEREQAIRMILPEELREALPAFPETVRPVVVPEEVIEEQVEVIQELENDFIVDELELQMGGATISGPSAEWRLTLEDMEMGTETDEFFLRDPSIDTGDTIIPSLLRGISTEPEFEEGTPGTREEIKTTLEEVGELTVQEQIALVNRGLQQAPSLRWPPSSYVMGPSYLETGVGTLISLHLDATVALALATYRTMLKRAENLIPESSVFGLGKERTDAELQFLIAPALDFRSTYIVYGLRKLADILDEEHSLYPEAHRELHWLVKALMVDEVRTAPAGKRTLVANALKVSGIEQILSFDVDDMTSKDTSTALRNYADVLHAGSFSALVQDHYDMNSLLPDGPLLLLAAAIQTNVRIHLMILSKEGSTQSTPDLRIVTGAYYPPLHIVSNTEEEDNENIPELGQLALSMREFTLPPSFQLTWSNILQSYMGAITPELVWKASVRNTEEEIKTRLHRPDNVLLLLDPRRGKGFRLLLSKKFGLRPRLEDRMLIEAIGHSDLSALAAASSFRRLFSASSLFDPNPLVLVPVIRAESTKQNNILDRLGSLAPALWNHLLDVWTLRPYLPPPQLALQPIFYLIAWAASMGRSEAAFRFLIQKLETERRVAPLIDNKPTTLDEIVEALQYMTEWIQESEEFAEALQSDTISGPVPEIVFQLLVANTVFTGDVSNTQPVWQITLYGTGPRELGQRSQTLAPTRYFYLLYSDMESRIQEKPVLRLLVNDTKTSRLHLSMDRLYHKTPFYSDSALEVQSYALNLLLAGPAAGNPTARGRHVFAALAQLLALPMVRLATPDLPGPASAELHNSISTRKPVSVTDIQTVEQLAGKMIQKAAEFFKRKNDSTVLASLRREFGFGNQDLQHFADELESEGFLLQRQTEEERYSFHARRNGSSILYSAKQKLIALHLAAASAVTYNSKGEIATRGVRLIVLSPQSVMENSSFQQVFRIDPSEELVREVHKLGANESVTGKRSRAEYVLLSSYPTDDERSWQYLPLVSSFQMGSRGTPLDSFGPEITEALDEMEKDEEEEEEELESGVVTILPLHEGEEEEGEPKRFQELFQSSILEENQEVFLTPYPLDLTETEAVLETRISPSALEEPEVIDIENRDNFATMDIVNITQGGNLNEEEEEERVLEEEIGAILQSFGKIPPPIVPTFREFVGAAPKELPLPTPSTRTPTPPPPKPAAKKKRGRPKGSVKRKTQLIEGVPPPTPPVVQPKPKAASKKKTTAKKTQRRKGKEEEEEEEGTKLFPVEIPKELLEAIPIRPEGKFKYEDHASEVIRTRPDLTEEQAILYTHALRLTEGYDYKSMVLYALAQSGFAKQNWYEKFVEIITDILQSEEPYREKSEALNLDAHWVLSIHNHPRMFSPPPPTKELKDKRTLVSRSLKGMVTPIPVGTPQFWKEVLELSAMNWEHWQEQLNNMLNYLKREAKRIESLIQGPQFDPEKEKFVNVKIPPVRWVPFADGTWGLYVVNRDYLHRLFFPQTQPRYGQSVWDNMTDSVNGKGWLIKPALNINIGGKPRIGRTQQAWFLVKNLQHMFLPNQPRSIFLWKAEPRDTKDKETGQVRKRRRRNEVAPPVTTSDQALLQNVTKQLREMAMESEHPRAQTAVRPFRQQIPGTIGDQLTMSEVQMIDLIDAQLNGVLIPQPAWQGPNSIPNSSNPLDRFESMYDTWWRLSSYVPTVTGEADEQGRVPIDFLETSNEGGIVFYGCIPVTQKRILSILASAVASVETERSSGIKVVPRQQPIRKIDASPSHPRWESVEVSLMNRCTIIHILEFLFPVPSPKRTKAISVDSKAELYRLVREKEEDMDYVANLYRLASKDSRFIFSSAATPRGKDQVEHFVREIAKFSVEPNKPVPAPERYYGAKFMIEKISSTSNFAREFKSLLGRAGNNLLSIAKYLLNELDQPVHVTHDYFKPRDIHGNIEREFEDEEIGDEDWVGFDTQMWLPILFRRQFHIPTWGYVRPVYHKRTRGKKSVDVFAGYEEFDWFEDEFEIPSRFVYVAHTGFHGKGNGLYAGTLVKTGQKVVRYAGMAHNVADFNEIHGENKLASYALNITDSTLVDAQLFGNEGRFANAEDRPSDLETGSFFDAIMYADAEKPSDARTLLNLPPIVSLFVYKRRYAVAGEELTFYYGRDYPLTGMIPRIAQRSFFLSKYGDLKVFRISHKEGRLEQVRIRRFEPKK